LILDAAQRLLSDGGADAVTIRGIAARVEVAPNAVYTYFPDKAAVLRALVERLLGEVNLVELTDRSQPARHRVQAVALQLRTRLLSHPGAVLLLLSAPMDGPNAVTLGEALLDVFAGAGLGSDHAARASYLLTAYVLGSIALEAAELDHSGTAPPERERVAARLVDIAAVAADDHPRTAAAAISMASYINTEQFTWGLDRVLDGVSPPDASVPTNGPRAGRPVDGIAVSAAIEPDGRSPSIGPRHPDVGR
jgi:AcrR family transcriptional regulator